METTTAAEIMSTQILSAEKSMTVEEALKILFNSRITGMPVLDEKKRLVGVLSEYDLLKQISVKKKNRKVFNQKIEYSKEVDSIPDTTPLETVIEKFIKSKYRRLPVTDKKGRLVGIITRRDLIRVYYYRAALS